MSRYRLYYAGMAADGATEQIGLALSDDGVRFTRVDGHGLVLPRDESHEWCALRVSNPTVLRDNGGYTMYYQGTARGDATPPHTSIGVARSGDGVHWAAEPEPIVPWRAMAAHDPEFDEQSRVGVIEPSVLHGPDGAQMWFVYYHQSRPGNAIFRAELGSSGGWRVVEEVLAGERFDDRLLHYPLVERAGDGYVMYLTLRDSCGVYGIFHLRSPDGRSWDGLEPVLPTDGSLEPSLRLRVLWHLPVRLRFRLVSGRRALGFAHASVVHGERTYLYHQVANLDADGLWLDVARAELGSRGLGRAQRVLGPAEDPAAWDARFVGDPFVLAEPD